MKPLRRRSLAQDARGVTVVEFAIVAPVLLLVIMGFGELMYRMYVQSVLTGAVQQAGRDSSIEAGDTNAIDQRVQTLVRTVAANATFTASRLNYDDYTSVAPEPFTDTNKNGKYDLGECYKDVNGNKKWDADPGATGQGGADDVTLYTMTVTYGRLFPAKLLGMGATETINAQTIMKNQPYQTQQTTKVVQLCS